MIHSYEFSDFICRIPWKGRKSLSSWPEIRFSSTNWIVIIKIVQPPIPQADAYFIDTSSNGIGGIHSPDSHQFTNTSFPELNRWNWCFDSSVMVNLLTLNIISDSAYVVGLFPAIEPASVLSSHPAMLPSLHRVQNLHTSLVYYSCSCTF